MGGGDVFHADVLVAQAAADDAVVEADVGVSAVLFVHLKTPSRFVDDIEAFGFTVWGDEHVIFRLRIHGLRKGGVEVDYGRSVGQHAQAEVFEPITGRLHGAAVSHVLAVQLYLARLFDQSVQQCEQTLELDPNYEPAYSVLGQVYSLTGRYERAMVEFEKSLAVTQRSTWVLALLGYARARSGGRSVAMDIIEELRATSQSSFVPALCFALVYAGLEEADQAFTWLCHQAGGELEQIQFLLGHASVQTTERYLGCKQRLSHAVNDSLGLEDT